MEAMIGTRWTDDLAEAWVRAPAWAEASTRSLAQLDDRARRPIEAALAEGTAGWARIRRGSGLARRNRGRRRRDGGGTMRDADDKMLSNRKKVLDSVTLLL